jgi:phospholipase D-like protein
MSHLVLATSLASISPPVLVALGVLGLIEIGLDVFALIDLYRRPKAQVVTGNKWIWVAIVLLVNLLGAILYLAVGRQQAPSADDSSQESPPREQVDSIVDSLYGKPPPDDRK